MAGERRYLGIREEYNFDAAMPSTVFLDFLSAGLETPSEPFIFYEGAGSRGLLLAAPGPYIPSGDLQVGVDPVEAIHFMKWGLGRYGLAGTASSPAVETTLDSEVSAGDTTVTVDDVTSLIVGDYVQISGGIGGEVGKITAVASNDITLESALLYSYADNAEVKRVVSPFTHMFRPALERTLPSFTARVGKDVFEHVFARVTIDRLSFNVERGFLTCTLSVQAQKDVTGLLNTSAKTFPRNIYTFRHATTLIASIDRSSVVEGFNLEIANNVDAEAGVRFGSRFPFEFPVQGVDVSGSLALAFNDMEEYSRFWGLAGGPDEDGANAFKLEQQFRSGNDWLKFVLGSVYWAQISTPVSGRGRITQEVQFKAIEDSIWDTIHVEAVNSKDRY